MNERVLLYKAKYEGDLSIFTVNLRYFSQIFALSLFINALDIHWSTYRPRHKSQLHCAIVI
jgi:hypothetical protein